ncbi:MAG: DUF1549 and DUF1553 domain-containing protein, partial [Planctomycetales bacterium]
SFQQVKRPEPPVARTNGWSKHPIDRFIASGLEAAGLAPSAPADKAALLRRAYYNLIGLPPSRADVENFLADDSRDAFEKVVDRLLASPQYGEKWGRHWLDLVRYAETNSYERDGAKPFVWRYRDYVIRSLNDDKPYDQFVREQLAGDEFAPDSADAVIATGYYRLGTWQDEPVDPVQELYEDLDDVAATTAEVFLGLNMGCCRCHDHKLDPIPQRDYYRFMGFFHGLNRYGVRNGASVAKWSLRPIATEEDRKRQAVQIEAHNKQVTKVDAEIAEIEKKVTPHFIGVEKQDFVYENRKVGLVKKYSPKVIDDKTFKRYVALKQQQKKLKTFKPSGLSQALCVTEIGRKPRETFVLARGNARVKGEKVEPGFPTVLGVPDPTFAEPDPQAVTSGRRRVLADWIANPQNPLTARVMVNRLWQYHFGRGIVRTTNDFGLTSAPPTHPELLDWLADEFVGGGWKFKRMHKMIMLSNAYQMSSRANESALAKDPENDLFWRFNMRRLGAEEIRDSILSVNGSLNSKMFGPSVYPDIPQEVKAGQSKPGSGWGRSSAEEQARRTVYAHVKRSLILPIVAAFDGPELDSTCPVRFQTTQP